MDLRILLLFLIQIFNVFSNENDEIITILPSKHENCDLSCENLEHGITNNILILTTDSSVISKPNDELTTEIIPIPADSFIHSESLVQGNNVDAGIIDESNKSPQASAFRDFKIFDDNNFSKKSMEKSNEKSEEIIIEKTEEKVESNEPIHKEVKFLDDLNQNSEEKVEDTLQKISGEEEKSEEAISTSPIFGLKISSSEKFINNKSEEIFEILEDMRPENLEINDKSHENHLDVSDEKISTLPEQSAFRDLHLFETKDKDYSIEDFDDNYEDYTNKMDSREKFTNFDEITGKTDSKFETIEDFGKFESFKNDEMLLRDIPAFNPTITIIDDKKTQNMLSKLVFPPVPRGDLYKVQGLGLGDGFFLFSFVGVLMSLFQPSEFPTGIAKDVILNRMSPQDTIYESLSRDPALVTMLTLGVMLALVAPVGLTIVGCVSAARRCRGTSCEDDNCSDNSSAESCGNCRRRGVVFAMQIILVLSVFGIAGVFIANEEIAMGTAQTTTVAKAALNDANTFVRNSNAQLNFVISNSLDQAVDATITDLDHMDQIVGRPVQREIATQTGVDVALDLLMDISMATQSMAEKCITLHQNAGSTRQLARATHERLVELRLQVDALKRQCPGRDRPLCDTLDSTGLEVTMNLDRLLGDLRLAHLRKLRNDSLSAQVQSARSEFQFIPHQMDSVTRDARQGIKRELEQQRTKIRDQLQTLDNLARQVSSRLQRIQDRTLQAIDDTPDIEQWRWIVGLVSGLTLLLIWLLLLSAILCGCCGAENQASCTVIFALLLVGLVTTAMWALALGSLVLGSHGEQLLCKPLYEEPDFKSLTALFDNPGGVYGSGKPGLFANLAFKNESMDVPLRVVLAECRDNSAAYRAFRLSRVFDAEHAAEHRTWGSLHAEISKLQVDLRQVQVLTPELQRQLQTLLDAANVDVTSIRNQLSGHVTSKDVSTFARQLESVAGQIRDSGASNRLESLVTRARRMLTNNIQPLEQRKEDLVYQLTALEVQLLPLQKQLNSSLAHLKTIQYFINNQGSAIAKEKSLQFSARLLHYVDQFQDYVLHSLRSEVAQCRPVWNIFQAGRQQACKYIVDPINGLWLSLMWCLVLLLTAIPTGLKLIVYYRRMKNSGIINKTTNSQESPPATNAWASPSSHAEQNDNW